MTELQLLSVLDKVGTVGLALIVYALWTGKLITRREFDAMATRLERTEAQRDKALEYGHRAIQAGQTLIDKQTSS